MRQEDAVADRLHDVVVAGTGLRPVAVARNIADLGLPFRHHGQVLCIRRDVTRMEPERHTLCRRMGKHPVDGTRRAMTVTYDTDLHLKRSSNSSTIARSALPR